MARGSLPTLALGVLAACAEAMLNSVRVEPAATAEQVAFRLDATASVYGLSVTTCDGRRVMWSIGTAASTSPMPPRVVYGVAPEGYEVREPAHPLGPGCYRVIITNSAPSTFTVGATGQVRGDTARR